MSYKRMTESLAQRWLMGVPVFGRALRDTGQTYLGWPVFEAEYRWLDDSVMVRVYRYAPTNCESSRLAFVPDAAVLS